MAKVTGPLFSIEARGKIADAMVHFPWKGINVVRGWVKPSNPKSDVQGDTRLKLGGLGRAMSVVDKLSLYHDDLLALATGFQTWVSEYIHFTISHILMDTAALETEYTAYTGHAHKSAFDTAAGTLGLVDFTIPYKGTSADMPGGFMVYLLARSAIESHALDSARFNRAPYTTALASWNTTECSALVTDLGPA